MIFGQPAWPSLPPSATNTKGALTAGSLHRRVPTGKRSPSHTRDGYGAESSASEGSAVNVSDESEIEDLKCAVASLLR